MAPDLTSVRYPSPPLDKLGVRPGDRVAGIALTDPGFRRRLAGRTTNIGSRVRADCDLIFFGVRNLKERERLAILRPSIKPAGAIWVIRVKGEMAAIKETDISAAARRQGLVDIKVVSFSGTHSALKLVIPVAKR